MTFDPFSLPTGMLANSVQYPPSAEPGTPTSTFPYSNSNPLAWLEDEFAALNPQFMPHIPPSNNLSVGASTSLGLRDPFGAFGGQPETQFMNYTSSSATSGLIAGQQALGEPYMPPQPMPTLRQPEPTRHFIDPFPIGTTQIVPIQSQNQMEVLGGSGGIPGQDLLQARRIAHPAHMNTIIDGTLHKTQPIALAAIDYNSMQTDHGAHSGQGFGMNQGAFNGNPTNNSPRKKLRSLMVNARQFIQRSKVAYDLRLGPELLRRIISQVVNMERYEHRRRFIQ